MPAIECSGKTINVDEDGFLLNFEDWDENVACLIAEREGIHELTRERVDIIKFMREYYKQYKSFPILGSVCKNIHQPKECVSEEFIDPLKAWKIAGLPRPGEEVVSYLKR